MNFDVLFDEPFAGGQTIRSSPGRSYRVPGSALINISHGTRVGLERNLIHRQKGLNTDGSNVYWPTPRKSTKFNKDTLQHKTPPDPKQLPHPAMLLEKNQHGMSKSHKVKEKHGEGSNPKNPHQPKVRRQRKETKTVSAGETPERDRHELEHPSITHDVRKVEHLDNLWRSMEVTIHQAYGLL